MAVGGSDNVIRLWDLASRQEQNRLVGHTGTVAALAWDATANTLLSGGFDTTVRVWQIKGDAAGRVSRRDPSSSLEK